MAPERLGQHFLAEPWRNRIAHAMFGLAAASPAETHRESLGLWIEIGAGHGEMTALLAQHAGRVIAIELDSTLVPRLREATARLENVAVVSGDVLALDLGELANRPDLGGQLGARFRVYGNLPYYISSPIVHRLFDHPERLDSAFLVVQREVAERIAASPGSRDYGYFSAFAQFYSHPEILLRLPPGAFRPPPQVDSALVALHPPGERAHLQIGDDRAFLGFLKACFAHKRKTLRNNLRALPSFAGAEEVLRQATIAAGIAPDARAEQLALAQFARLFAATQKP
jgi:16S rRNA (adenine1518-N6/adenine1519-N6)-dimethyltransferase